jgi:hypothetical protein
LKLFDFFQEAKLKQLDPKRAAQAERLGMGGMSSKPGISHSMITEISSIEQVYLSIL